MEAKVPASPQPQTQPQQPPGQVVIFKAAESSGRGISFSAPGLKTVLAVFVMLFLVGGVGVGVYLVGQQQQLKSKASSADIPDNLSKVVPKNVVNDATPSSQPSSPAASVSADLSDIKVPDLEPIENEASLSGETTINYDFSEDGMVNSVDLSVMYSGWGTPVNESQMKADLNRDGIINGIDYSLFLPHFSQ